MSGWHALWLILAFLSPLILAGVLVGLLRRAKRNNDSDHGGGIGRSPA